MEKIIKDIKISYNEADKYLPGECWAYDIVSNSTDLTSLWKYGLTDSSFKLLSTNHIRTARVRCWSPERVLSKIEEFV